MRFRYDIYEGDKQVLSNATAKDVCEFTGLPANSNLTNYRKNDGLIRGKYKVYVSEKEEEKVEPKTSIYSKFTEKMLTEWRYMNRKYGRRCSG